jgi:hypothetical protein
MCLVNVEFYFISIGIQIEVAGVKPRKYMFENLRKSNKEDIRINMRQEYEIIYWSRKWGISALQLENAVKAAGSNVVRNIEEHLRQTGKLSS